MWNGKDLKEKGKAAFKANYWRCVLAGVILSAVSGSLFATASQRSDEVSAASQNAKNILDGVDPSIIGALAVLALSVISMGVVINILVRAFLLNPLDVGCRRFFIQNGRQPADASEIGYAFKHNYFDVIKTMFLRDLYLGLWSMLCLIPGIVKAYSYRLVPYIMAENPGISGNEAITLSRSLMNGNKMKAFLLDLSFFGWDVLAALTLGLVGVFYSNPYQYATGAELYKAIRSESN